MDALNILFTSVGRRVSLVKHFKDTLKSLHVNGKIITTDLQRNAPASFVSDIHELVPRVTDATYIDELISICDKHNIKLLVPLIDTELILLAENRKRFEEVGVELLVSSVETNKICFDKENTTKFFLEKGISTPKAFDIEKVLMNKDTQYPLLLKPVSGSSSKGVTIIKNSRELEFFKNYIKDPMLQEYVTGEEYTVDVLVGFDGEIYCTVPRLRIETRAGEVSKGMTEKNQRIIEASNNVVSKLPGAVGCITVQCFLTQDNEVKFIEINPRFGGGHPLTIASGADFPKFILNMLLGESLEKPFIGWKDQFLMLRYDDAIYLEGDRVND